MEKRRWEVEVGGERERQRETERDRERGRERERESILLLFDFFRAVFRRKEWRGVAWRSSFPFFPQYLI